MQSTTKSRNGCVCARRFYRLEFIILDAQYINLWLHHVKATRFSSQCIKMNPGKISKSLNLPLAVHSQAQTYSAAQPGKIHRNYTHTRSGPTRSRQFWSFIWSLFGMSLILLKTILQATIFHLHLLTTIHVLNSFGDLTKKSPQIGISCLFGWVFSYNVLLVSNAKISSTLGALEQRAS